MDLRVVQMLHKTKTPRSRNNVNIKNVMAQIW